MSGRYYRAHRGGVECVVTEAKEEQKKCGVKTIKKQTRAKYSKQTLCTSVRWTPWTVPCRDVDHPLKGEKGNGGGVKKEVRRPHNFFACGVGVVSPEYNTISNK